MDRRDFLMAGAGIAAALGTADNGIEMTERAPTSAENGGTQARSPSAHEAALALWYDRPAAQHGAFAQRNSVRHAIVSSSWRRHCHS